MRHSDYLSEGNPLFATYKKKRISSWLGTSEKRLFAWIRDNLVENIYFPDSYRCGPRLLFQCAHDGWCERRGRRTFRGFQWHMMICPTLAKPNSAENAYIGSFHHVVVDKAEGPQPVEAELCFIRSQRGFLREELKKDLMCSTLSSTALFRGSESQT